MTAKDVFEFRQQGRTEEAYEAARHLYATDKGPYPSLAMFWTAVDVLRVRVGESRTEEAQKILMALERMLPNVPDKEGWVRQTFENCGRLLGRADKRRQLYENGAEHLQTGIWGEELAAAFLRGKGYVILERNWRSKHRDIDIIARHGDDMVFVEVKTRQNSNYGDPAQAIGYKKRHNLQLAMNHYLKYRHIDMPAHFDIISIIGSPGCTSPVITHLENASIMR